MKEQNPLANNIFPLITRLISYHQIEADRSATKFAPMTLKNPNTCKSTN
jgi:hypothetical protein